MTVFPAPVYYWQRESTFGPGLAGQLLSSGDFGENKAGDCEEVVWLHDSH